MELLQSYATVVDKKNFYQPVRMMTLPVVIFPYMYIAYVYNEIFTRLNGIFTHLGRVDVDFLPPLCYVIDIFVSMTQILSTCTLPLFVPRITEW